MNRIFTSIAAAAVFGLAASQGTLAFETLDAAPAYITGTGTNQSVANAGVARRAVTQPRAVVTGSGENLSVQHLDVPAPAPRAYIAVVEGSGENLSVRHIPVPAPRG